MSRKVKEFSEDKCLSFRGLLVSMFVKSLVTTFRKKGLVSTFRVVVRIHRPTM